MTRVRWGPALLPRLRTELVAAGRQIADRMAAITAAGGVAGFDPDRLADTATTAADRLQTAEMIWVAHDMAVAALDASGDIPIVDPGLAPWPAGLLVLERPLPSLPPARPLTLLDHTEWAGPLPVDALSWHRDGRWLHVARYCRRGALPGAGVQGGQLQEVAGIRLRRDRPLDLAAEHELAVVDGHPADELRVLALLGAAWVLMGTPTVARRRVLDPATSALTPAPPDLVAPAGPRAVTLVDLRPLRHVTADQADPCGRVYRHRWIVRGHWRQQPHGPGGSLRRPVWVDSYTKGPDGAPLLTTDKVITWRR